MTTPQITVRWLDSTQDLLHDSLLAEAFHDISDVKRKALERLNIACKPDQGALDAYLTAMCAENGFPNTRPVPSELTDAILSSGAMRFVWFLA